MERRTALAGLLTTCVGGLAVGPLRAHQLIEGPWGQMFDEGELIAKLGMPVRKVAGSEALATWEALRASGEGYPVILGDISALAQTAEGKDSMVGAMAETSVETIIEEGLALEFPKAIHDLREEEQERFLKAYPQYADEADDGPIDFGPWPKVAPVAAGLTVHADVLTEKPFDTVYIVIVPGEHGWHVPAHLRWGGWNACPMPKYHVAALRSWGQRYGAELVGMDGSTMNLRVKRRPETREEALALAHAQYDYCNDIVDQGVDTIANLAASLMESDWWYFWWD